jgi:hypothetical protein
MKKVIVPIFLLVFVLCISAYSQETKKHENQNYTTSGTIKVADRQGNNYLKLTILSSKDKKNIFIWCSGEKTRVYESKKKSDWNMLTLERKIKVSGSWINQDGEKLLWASRIDLL